MTAPDSITPAAARQLAEWNRREAKRWDELAAVVGKRMSASLELTNAAALESLASQVEGLTQERDRIRNTLNLHAGDVMSLDNEVLSMRAQRDDAEACAEKAERELAKKTDLLEAAIAVLSAISNGPNKAAASRASSILTKLKSADASGSRTETA